MGARPNAETTAGRRVACDTCKAPAGLACVSTITGERVRNHPTRGTTAALRAERRMSARLNPDVRCPCGGGEWHHLCGKAVIV